MAKLLEGNPYNNGSLIKCNNTKCYVTWYYLLLYNIIKVNKKVTKKEKIIFADFWNENYVEVLLIFSI